MAHRQKISQHILLSICSLALLGFTSGCSGGGPSSTNGPSPGPTPAPTPTPAAGLAVTPNSLTLSSTAGAADPGSQTFMVTSNNGTPLNWTATATTTAGGNWLTVSPTSGTTPATVTVSAHASGLGASDFAGNVLLTAGSSTASANIDLHLAPPQPPYFGGSTTFLLPPQGAVTITMPDGSSMPGATNQLLVDLDPAATVSNMQAVASAITAANAEVVGEIPATHELQVQVGDPSTIPGLMLTLQGLSGVIHVGPNFVSPALDAFGCTNGGPTPWSQFDNLGPSTRPADASNFAMCIVDCFNAANCTIPGVGATHGDIVAAFAQDAAGNDANGQPLFQAGKNLFKIDVSNTQDFASVKAAAAGCVASNPGKKVLVNLSVSPLACNGSGDPTACANAQSEWYQQTTAAAKEFGDNVILVKSAGNVGVTVKPLASLSSCRMIPVGGLDQISPNVTLTSGMTVGAPIPVYAPACGVSPLSLKISSPVDGTSFSAPQVLGQLAAIWAANPGLGACQVGSQVFALPKLSPTQTGAQLNGQALAQAVSNLPPASQPPGVPLAPLPCPAISISPGSSVLNAGQSVKLTATATGASQQPTFQFLSGNTNVATVDPASGVVNALHNGVAWIYATAPNLTCAGQATISVPAEQYSGTLSLQVSDTFPNTPGFIPTPITTTGTVTAAPIQMTVTQSLLTPGAITGVLTVGPGTINIVIPAQTCTVCNPPVTVPGVNESVPLSVFSSVFAGTTDGKILTFPIADGFPPITGTVTVLGPTVQVMLNWNFTESDGVGGTIQLQTSASLTKQ